MRMLAKPQPAHLTRLGLDVIAAGIAFGLVVLAVFAIAGIGGAGRRRPGKGRTDRRRGAARQDSATASRGRDRSPGHGKDRLRDITPPGGGHAPRDGAARSARPSVLNPTNVYTPGGLIDVPRDGHRPGRPDGEDIPEILRPAGTGPAHAGPAPGAPAGSAPGAQAGPVSGAPAGSAPGGSAGGWNQVRPSSGRAGPQPSRHGYPPGMSPGGPERVPYGPSGQPVRPVPPRDHGRPREAPRPAYPMPGRDGVPGRDGGPGRDGVPGRDGGPPRGARPAETA